MADMLIDSVKFAACNTVEADAIRAKTGSTEPIVYDYENNKGFADAIAAISGGGDTKDVNAVAEGKWWPEKVVIDTAARIEQRTLNNMYGVKTLVVGSQVRYVGPYMINNNEKLTTIVYNATSCNAAAPFINNAVLSKFDGSFTNVVGILGWQGCAVLDTIILRNSNGVCGLPNVNCFNSTPFRNGGTGGTIYVPAALLPTYRAATNWSMIDSYGTITWAQIEGSQYEHYYADGTPIPTE